MNETKKYKSGDEMRLEMIQCFKNIASYYGIRCVVEDTNMDVCLRDDSGSEIAVGNVYYSEELEWRYRWHIVQAPYEGEEFHVVKCELKSLYDEKPVSVEFLQTALNRTITPWIESDEYNIDGFEEISTGVN